MRVADDKHASVQMRVDRVHQKSIHGELMNFSRLFSPLTVGQYRLSHRVIMAPLTRMRAQEGTVAAHALNVQHYKQRASEGGLIIAEASQVSLAGQGYPATPGIHSERQIEGWRDVTDAVHLKGGRIFLQLWHVGRVSHSSLQPNGALPVAPSAIRINGETLTASWKSAPFETPRALETEEITEVVESFRQGAKNAKLAGFDGVELHGANGYLVEQFLQSRTNQRSDRYGGSMENRCRFLKEAVDALIDVWGSDRVAVRLSPYGVANESGEDDPVSLYRHVLRQLSPLGLSYLHFIEPRSSGAGRADVNHQNVPSALELFRSDWSGVLIGAGGFAGASAEAAIASGRADAIAFGRAFIANPDLPKRLKLNIPLNPYNRATFYGGGAAGYTDYSRYDT
ncbi:N-ethylmaleimide reductase [Bradyrhizobium sp. USDA 4341]